MAQPSPRSPAFSSAMFVVEWASIFAFAATGLYVGSELWSAAGRLGLGILPALLGIPMGHVAATLFTGFGHFFSDNFMKVDTPIIGHALIFRFRQHHEDQMIICRLSFRELNGGLAGILLPFLAIVALFVPISTTVWGAFVGVSALSMAVFGAGTNQIHRWAHDAHRPGWVVWLQRNGLALGPKHHSTHHRAPYDVAFCITHGALNPLLDKSRFWHHLADLIAALGVHQDPESVMGWRARARHAEAARARAETTAPEPSLGAAGLSLNAQAP